MSKIIVMKSWESVGVIYVLNGSASGPRFNRISPGCFRRSIHSWHRDLDIADTAIIRRHRRILVALTMSNWFGEGGESGVKEKSISHWWIIVLQYERSVYSFCK